MLSSLTALAALVSFICLSKIAAVRNGNIPPSEMTVCQMQCFVLYQKVLRPRGRKIVRLETHAPLQGGF